MNASPDTAADNRAAREVTHDFSNLLTAILGAAETALERSGIDPETRGDIAHIREGARRGVALIQRLRGGVDDTKALPGLISVGKSIRATSRLLAHHLGAGITLKLELQEGADQVRADAAQLDRAVLNLIANAGHALPDGGTVTLGTSRRVVQVVEQRIPEAIPPGDYVVIAVEDTGNGISQDQISRIFQPDFSAWRHTDGSGLGLSSIRDVVRQAGGFLAVESEAGRGARFEIYLPRHEIVTPEFEAPRSPVGTVLLVEDDLLVRQVAERVLRRAGWNVLCAESAEAALTILEAAACDLMISDVALHGMDGVALARHVQGIRPGLPIILTSGYERATTEDGFETSDFAFLAKPYGQDDLLGVVARIARDRATGLPTVA